MNAFKILPSKAQNEAIGHEHKNCLPEKRNSATLHSSLVDVVICQDVIIDLFEHNLQITDNSFTLWRLI